MTEANNMDCDSIYALLQSQVERRHESVKKDKRKSAPVPSARKAGKKDNNKDGNKRQNIECWYFGKMGHQQGKCSLRRRKISAPGRVRGRDHGRG